MARICGLISVFILQISSTFVTGQSYDRVDRRYRRPYYGERIGDFKEYAHGVKGQVYAVDDDTFFVKGFTYDGRGPDAFFWVGDTKVTSPQGILVPYPDNNGTEEEAPVLQSHKNADILVNLPNGIKLADIKWISVWCRRFTVNFGDVYLPLNLNPPRPKTLPEFRRLAHGLRSGNITILDKRTFYIPNLHYDGLGPAAYFWVGTGAEPGVRGTVVPDEKGSKDRLEKYSGMDIEIQLPGNLTVDDIDWLSMWCKLARQNFGHVFIPKNLHVPPALGQTKITTTKKPRVAFPNCVEPLPSLMQARWALDGTGVIIELSARIQEGQYMAFGISGEQGRSDMIGADVVVAFFDDYDQEFKAVDYHLSERSQCDGRRGVCPDTRIGGTNDAVIIIGEVKDGVTTIRYRRPIPARNRGKDIRINTSDAMSVVAAIGQLNKRNEANYHETSWTGKETDYQIRFGATNEDNCYSNLWEENNGRLLVSWRRQIVRGVTEMTARIGPTGKERGYSAITGQPSWGLAWYINDKLIPEVYVERYKTYRFVVEGGDDPRNPARFHPLYITDSREGGYGQKSEQERDMQRVFAGVEIGADGYPYPTAAGRLCEWRHKDIDKSSDSKSFEEFKDTLMLDCEEGEPAELVWYVEPDTPDTVYYQCYTHNNLGWKIHVVDPGYTGSSTVSAPLSMALLLLSALGLLL